VLLALEKHSKLTADRKEAILYLNDIYLSNMITLFENNFSIQDKGIATGDNHSVS